MDIVCEVCGDVGYKQLLVQCCNCKNDAMHLYCFDPVIYDASSFEWLCGDCPPKHNEVPKSLEWNCDHSHKIPRWKGSRNVIEEHNMLFEKGFDKAGVRIFSRPENMNDVLETRSATSFHVPDDSSCDDHYSIQLGSITNEPNVNRIEVTKEPLSWGCRRHRSHKARCTWGCRRRRSQKARRESSDASTKHGADTFNSSEMFDVKNSKCNDILEEAESKNDLLIYQPESVDGSSHSASDRIVEIQKTGGAVGPTMNKIECLDLSMEKDSCSFSLNCVEGFTQGTKPELLPLINDVERSYLFVTDSCPTVPNMEQKDGVLENVEQLHPSEMVNPDGTSHSPVGPALEIEEQGAEAGLFFSVEDVEEQVDGSSPASESWEQSVPLKVVILRPWHDVPNEPPSNNSQSMQGSDLYVGNMDVLDPSKEWLDSRLKLDEQGAEPGLFASVKYVEQTHPNFTDKTSPIWSSEGQVDGSSPTSESWEQPEPLEVVRPWDDVPDSILRSKPPSNYSQPMQVSDHVGNMDVLDPSKERMESWLMPNTVEPSSSSNGGGTSVEKDNTEKTECLLGMNNVTLELNNVQGSNPSAEPSSSLNGEGALAVEEHSTEMTGCLLGMGTLTPALHNVQALNPSTPKEAVEEHSTEMTGCLLGMGTLTPALHNVQALNPSTPKECLVSNADNSDEANRSDEVHLSRNDKGPNRHIPHHTKHQKTKLVMKDRNTDPAHISCRPSKQIDHTCSSASFDLSPKTKEVNDANDAEPRYSKSVRTLENVMVRKRKRLVLSYDDDEDAEAMQTEVRMRTGHVKSHVLKQRRATENSEEAISPGNSNNHHANDDMRPRKQRRANKDKKTTLENVMVKKCTGHVKSRVLKQQRSAENSEEAISPGNSNNQHANDDMKARKQRRAKKDKKAPLGNASVPCTRNATLLASDQQSFICMGTKNKPFWTGLMKIGQDYISLVAHLSNQACKEVQELSLSLPALMKVTKHSKLKAWPGRWKASEPTAKCIGLYFFSDNIRELDQLVHYLTDHSLVLKYVVGCAKLLIFPSVFLPEQCQKFQGKHYLWGVFKRRMGTEKLVPQQTLSVGCVQAQDGYRKAGATA